MDWLTFFSSVIDSLAWPSAFFAVWFVIYKELPTTIRSLRKLRFKDVELEFGEAARAVAAETKKAVPSRQKHRLQAVHGQTLRSTST